MGSIEAALAERTSRHGVSYLSFGSVFPSPTKPHAVNCPRELMNRTRGLGLAIPAVGGLTFENAEIEARARQFQTSFDPELHEPP